jgi:hypothetical protein
VNDGERRLVTTEARLTALALLRAALENTDPEGKDLPPREVAAKADEYVARTVPLLDAETGDPDVSAMAAMALLVAMLTSVSAGALEALSLAKRGRRAARGELLADFAQFEEGFLLGRRPE